MALIISVTLSCTPAHSDQLLTVSSQANGYLTLPRWTDTHTYARIKDMTQQYTGVDVEPALFSQIISKNLKNKLSYLMGIIM